jgi:hypothetical protein
MTHQGAKQVNTKEDVPELVRTSKTREIRSYMARLSIVCYVF